MKLHSFLTALSLLIVFGACAQKQPIQQPSNPPTVIKDSEHYNTLNNDEAYVLLKKGTERAFTGSYHDQKEEGVYICKQCNLPLFRSEDKFNSGTGWPSFDDMIAENVKEVPDADGSRTEIICDNCAGHLGHVFRGEGFTKKQTRHCVNAVSLNFIPASIKEAPKNDGVQPIADYVQGKGYEQYGVAVFAGGCFWCTEAAFERIEGVVDVISGYSGGVEEYPSYEEVAYKKTSHAEAIIIYYDESTINFETLLDIFFVAHDPTQLNRQGPDVGPQYRSAIFYRDEDQKAMAEAKVKKLDGSGKFSNPVVTELAPYSEFWVAEGYHQDYYEAHPENPYVQRVSRPKVEKVEKTFADILKEKYR